jgi:hypothetical protein
MGRSGRNSFDTGVPVSDPDLPHRSLAADDFNADGNQDLVATHVSAASVSVLLGKRRWNVQDPANLRYCGRPVSVAVADFNSDHIQDLAVGCSLSSFPPSVSVLLGNGTFGTWLDPSVPLFPRCWRIQRRRSSRRCGRR